MQKLRSIVVFFFLSPTLLLAQKKCACETMDSYIAKRDLDSLETYNPVSLKTEGWFFVKMKNPRCRAFGNQLMAQFYLSRLDFEKAKEQLDKELFILDSIGCSKSAYLENDLGYGDYYMRIGEYKFALEAYSRHISLFKKSGNHNMYSHALLGISAAQSKLNDEKAALAQIQTAYDEVIHLPDGISKTDNLFRLSSRYYYQYERTRKSYYLDSSINLANFGLMLAKRYNYPEGKVEGYNLLENRAYHSRNYRQALLYLDSALAATSPAIHFNDREGIYSDRAGVYLELKQYEKAYDCADSALFYARKLNNPYREKNALELLYNCAKLSGEYERALDVYVDLTKMRDSVTKLKSLQRYNELEERYRKVQTAKDEKENLQDNKLLRQQREIGALKRKLIIVGIIIFALLTIYLFMVFRQKNMKQKQKRLEIRQRVNQARINPEFLHSSLQAIQQTTDSVGHTKKLTALSKLIKKMAESAQDDFVTIDKEVEFLTLYLDLQRSKASSNFNYSFEIDDNLDQSDVCIPTMMIQPFLEYSIEHGFNKLNYEGQLTIRMLQTPNNELFIQLQDNGKGLKAVDSLRATEMINDRLYLLNKVNNSSHSYVVRERQSGGVSVDIYLPLISVAMAEKLKSEMD